MYSDELRNLVKYNRDLGKSYGEIAKILNLSRYAVGSMVTYKKNLINVGLGQKMLYTQRRHYKCEDILCRKMHYVKKFGVTKLYKNFS